MPRQEAAIKQSGQTLKILNCQDKNNVFNEKGLLKRQYIKSLTYQSNQCATTPLIPLIKKMFARSVFLFF
jgi:hypothetical protein